MKALLQDGDLVSQSIGGREVLTLTRKAQDSIANRSWSTRNAPNDVCYGFAVASIEPTTDVIVNPEARFVDMPVSVTTTPIGSALLQNAGRFSGVNLGGTYIIRFAPEAADGSAMISAPVSALGQSRLTVRVYIKPGSGGAEVASARLTDDQRARCRSLPEAQQQDCRNQAYKENLHAVGVAY
ncbi:MAG: hypothetical protein M3N13_01580 [Candidatus Eremiobacteraeota bacterium]|nr:hypothetical protein [Candidatus Eremiobacteraeota bacterium]